MTPTDLKTQRKWLGLSQAALADLLGCHKQAIHYWETGKRPIPRMLELAMQALRKGIKTVTSDELIDQLKSPARWWWSDHPKGERKIVSLAPQEAAARIRELEAELAFYKGFHDGVCRDGTHVVVPVEPTEKMMDAGQSVRLNRLDGSPLVSGIYSAMIRAAQPDAKHPQNSGASN